MNLMIVHFIYYLKAKLSYFPEKIKKQFYKLLIKSVILLENMHYLVDNRELPVPKAQTFLLFFQ